ncbi:MAG: tetratricopeptide repeat protein [Limisphaerales bacterium]
MGGEAHRLYREFIEHWQDSRRDPKTRLPLNHDFEKAGEEALGEAMLVLVMELAGRIEPKKSWLTRWVKELPGGGIFAADIFPGAKDPQRLWLDALRKEIRGEHFANLCRSLKVNDKNLFQCFAQGDVCKALAPCLADAVLEWTRFNLQGKDEHLDFEHLVRQGWLISREDSIKLTSAAPLSEGLAAKGIPDAVEPSRRITLCEVYCLFFREHLKRNPRVFRIVVADALTAMRDKLDGLGAIISAELNHVREEVKNLLSEQARLDFSEFERWLDPQLGEIKNLLSGVRSQLDTLAASQRQIADKQGEILVAIATLRCEKARGNHCAEAGLGALREFIERFERKLDYLLAGLPIQRFELPDPPTHALQLLHAKQRAVELVGRDTDLADLLTWLNAKEPISARLLVGRAGTGKTRLALELLLGVNAELPEWQAGFLDGNALRKFDATKQASDWKWSKPTLVVVDYAQTLAVPLTDLMHALTHKRRDGLPPLRILLLERQAGDWFDDLLRKEDGTSPCAVGVLFHPGKPLELTPLPEGELRRRVLSQTLQRAARLAGKVPPALPPDGDPDYEASLKRDIFAQPLNLMLAALVADKIGLQPALARSRIELAVALAEKELRRLKRFARTTGVPAEERAMCHLAACATMERGFTTPELELAAQEELEALHLEWPGGPGDLASALQNALPGDRLAVAPVEPDFVGEALVLTALAQPDHGGKDRWKSFSRTVERCSRRNSRMTPATLLHAFQNFGQLPKYGEPLLAATDALIRTGLANVEPELLLGIEKALPHQTTELRRRAVEVTRHLYARLKDAMRRGPKELGPDVAGLANNLGFRLSVAGLHAEALAPAQEAVEILRVLARQNPDAFQPNLAGSLNNLAMVLSELGRRAEALASAQEAVEIHRVLARQNPDAFQPNLAGSLNNLANRLSQVGRRAEALAPAQEAVEIRRALAGQNPDAFQPDLAMSLNNLASRLSELGRRTEALAPAQEAVEIRRALSRQNPDAFQSDLAMSLNTLANRLSELGRRTEALAPAQEAVEIRRTLAGQNPDAFQPDLATSLFALSQVLAGMEQHVGAAKLLVEGIRTLERLFFDNPAAFAPLMRWLVQAYLTATKAVQMAPDMELLTPILKVLHKLK